MASGSEDKTIKIWNIEIFCVLAILKGHSQSVTSLSFNNKGIILASGSEDNNIKIWNLETQRKFSFIEKENAGCILMILIRLLLITKEQFLQ